MSNAPIVERNAIKHGEFAPIFADRAERTLVQAYPWRIENRLNLSEEELARACVLLDLARHQQHFAASPCRSQFKVGSSVYCGQNRVAVGSNAEYGAGPRSAYDEGVHSEEVAVVNALNHFGKVVLVEMVGLASDATTPSTSCGKCRSLLETYGDRDVTIVSAGEGTHVSMWRLSELFPSNMSSVRGCSLALQGDPQLVALQQAVEQARKAGFIPFSEQTLGRSVAAIAASGAIFSLPRVDSLAFYGTSSLRATISAVFLQRPKELQAVLISSRTGLPTGEDRQLLFEFSSLFGQTETLPVYLHVEGTERVYVTTPSALLPFGFGPKDLVLEDGMTGVDK